MLLVGLVQVTQFVYDFYDGCGRQRHDFTVFVNVGLQYDQLRRLRQPPKPPVKRTSRL